MLLFVLSAITSGSGRCNKSYRLLLVSLAFTNRRLQVSNRNSMHSVVQVPRGSDTGFLEKIQKMHGELEGRYAALR